MFRTTRDGDDEIYTMNADGSDQINFSRSPATEERRPAWSPDGRRIAFASVQAVILDIFTLSVTKPYGERSSWANLTGDTLGGDEYPDWSPNGTRIAFHSDRDGNWEIYVMSADASGQTQVTNTPASDWNPVWQPLPSHP